MQTLRILKRLNPNIPIHGLYGGNDSLEYMPADLVNMLETIWVIPIDDPYYKWKNGDLCVRWWFKDQGKKISFGHLFLLEWDMIFFKPLENVFLNIEADTNYTPMHGNYNKAKSAGWYWVNQQYGEEVTELLAKLYKRGYEVNLDNLSFGLMGATILCRKFLELFANEIVPSYSNDGLRLSIYSSAFKIPLKDNNIYNNQANKFDADNATFTDADIQSVIEKDGDIIHPIRHVSGMLNTD